MQLRPQAENYFGSSKRIVGFYLLPRYLRAQFISAAWTASSMRWIRSQGMSDGDSRRRRESDHLPPFKIRQCISAAMMESSMRWPLKLDKRNGGLRLEAQSFHRQLLLVGLHISAAPTLIFTLSMWKPARESGNSMRRLVG